MKNSEDKLKQSFNSNEKNKFEMKTLTEKLNSSNNELIIHINNNKGI